jgi:dihydropteroate synthase
MTWTKSYRPGAPRIMGVLNVTPDSFSDGGHHHRFEDAVRHGLAMVEQGAAILDVGGESSRPGAEPVSDQQEVDRVIPVIEKIAQEADVIISIDTCKTPVMREAVSAGATIVNDINALRSEGALELVAALDVSVCLMHMQGQPRHMQQSPSYSNVVGEVLDFLLERTGACLDAGITADKLIIDPGLGFGKTVDHNLSLLANLRVFVDTGFEVLIGISRKQTIGTVLGRGVDERLHGSLGLAVQAVLNGARIVRVHDVRPTADALNMVDAVLQARELVARRASPGAALTGGTR